MLLSPSSIEIASWWLINILFSDYCKMRNYNYTTTDFQHLHLVTSYLYHIALHLIYSDVNQSSADAPSGPDHCSRLESSFQTFIDLFFLFKFTCTRCRIYYCALGLSVGQLVKYISNRWNRETMTRSRSTFQISAPCTSLTSRGLMGAAT